MDEKPLHDEILEAYEYDSDGYFEAVTQVQVDSATGAPVGLPERTTLTPPPVKSGYFARWSGTAWSLEKIPTTAGECVGRSVALSSETAHDRSLRSLFERLTEGSTTHRLVRTENRVWYVEPIPEEEHKAEEAAQELADFDGQIQALKDRLLSAVLMDDEETAAAVKSEYRALLGE